MDLQAKITTILGMRGSGKSFLTRALAMPKPRKIIFDKMKEWKDVPGAALSDSFDSFAGLWEANWHRDDFIIIQTFPFGSSIDQSSALAGQICEVIYRTGLESSLETTTIFEEAQFYFPNQYLPPGLMEILTTGRHANMNIFANSQRPALISKLLISQSHDLYVGQLYEKRDIEYLRGTIGSDVEKISKLQKHEFLHASAGMQAVVVKA